MERMRKKVITWLMLGKKATESYGKGRSYNAYRQLGVEGRRWHVLKYHAE